MQEKLIQRYSDLKRDELIREYFGNKTRCEICGNNLFKVERISPERIMLMCENCKETHLICAEICGEDTLRARVSEFLVFRNRDEKIKCPSIHAPALTVGESSERMRAMNM